MSTYFKNNAARFDIRPSLAVALDALVSRVSVVERYLAQESDPEAALRFLADTVHSEQQQTEAAAGPAVDPDLECLLIEEELIEIDLAITELSRLPSRKEAMRRRIDLCQKMFNLDKRITRLPLGRRSHYKRHSERVAARLTAEVFEPPVETMQTQQHNHPDPQLHGIGTIVLPVSPLEGEIIVGVIVNQVDADDYEVIWLSDSRGFFRATEYVDDLTYADLRGRPEAADTLLNSLEIALLLSGED